MEGFIESGAVFDLVVAVLVVEAVLMTGLWWRRAQGIPPVTLLPDLGAAAALLIAARAHTLDAGWLVIGAALAVALLLHVTHLRRQWR